MDSHLPVYNLDAEKYHQLARAALFQTSVFDDEPTLAAVQTLLLMAFYLFLADRHGSRAGSRWALMALVVKLAQSVCVLSLFLYFVVLIGVCIDWPS
jgi:hypothetical protein